AVREAPGIVTEREVPVPVEVDPVAAPECGPRVLRPWAHRGDSVRDMSQEAKATQLVVKCDCGFEVRGDEETLVPAVQKHGIEAHNMQVTREQVLAMARPA